MTVSPPLHHPVQRPPSAHFRAFALGPGGGRPATEPAALAVKTALAWAMSITVSFTAFLFTLIYFSRVFIMTKFNDLILREFLQDLADITHQSSDLWRAHYPPVHVFIEPSASTLRRPTAIVIAVELQPSQLIMSTLENEIADQYLSVGDKTWPDGTDSALKRQVAARFEAFLALLNPDWSRSVQPLGEHARSQGMRRSRSRATRVQRLIPQLAKPAVTE